MSFLTCSQIWLSPLVRQLTHLPQKIEKKTPWCKPNEGCFGKCGPKLPSFKEKENDIAIFRQQVGACHQSLIFPIALSYL
jgi:hypothetical protein